MPQKAAVAKQGQIKQKYERYGKKNVQTSKQTCTHWKHVREEESKKTTFKSNKLQTGKQWVVGNTEPTEISSRDQKFQLNIYLLGLSTDPVRPRIIIFTLKTSHCWERAIVNGT